VKPWGWFLPPLSRIDPPKRATMSERAGTSLKSAILNQIDEEGNYSQQSANYQRMMLQLALL
jgi:hypothetical protein